MPNSPKSARMDRDRFLAFAFAAAHLLIEIDPEDEITFATGASCGLIDGMAEDLVGNGFVGCVEMPDRGYVQEVLRRLRSTGRLEPVRVRMQSHQGARLWFTMGGCLLPNKPGHCFVSLSHMVQAPDAKKLTEDGLTERGSFTGAANARMRVANQIGAEEDMTLLLLDGLDKLKEEYGEETAAEVVSSLSDYLRSISVGGEFAGEITEEKFGVVHNRQTSGEEIRARVDGLLKRAGPPDAQLGVQTVTLPLEAQDLSETDAAKALSYAIRKFAEAEGADFKLSTLQAGAEQILAEVRERLVEVRATIEKRNFDVVFQPIVDMRREEVHHFEALTRIIGMASPAEFIKFNEEIGLIEDFDLALAQKVLETLKTHAVHGWTPEIAINLSARSVSSPLFLKQLFQVIEPFGKLRRNIMVEVTETAAIKEVEHLHKGIQELQRNGHRISIDDIGQGTTSFHSLFELGAEFAKIDGKFVRSADRSDRDFQMLKALVQTSQKMGMEVIGEQIEEDHQARTLQKMGVTFGQGYLYGRPSADYTSQALTVKARSGGAAALPRTRVNAHRRGDRVTWG